MIKRISKMALCGFLAISLAGCTVPSIPFFNKTGVTESKPSASVFTFDHEDVSLSEVWIYAEIVRGAYERRYGSAVWGIETMDSDEKVASMEEITKRDVINDIRITKAMAKNADALGVTISDDDIVDIRSDSVSFFKNLTDEQIKAMDLTEELVEKVYTENVKANRVRELLMAEGSVEISDEEARMTTFYDLLFPAYTEDALGNAMPYSADQKLTVKETAEAALAEYENTENPLTNEEIASKHNLKFGGKRTLSTTDMVAEYGEEVVNLLYSLGNGEHTQVVETEYGYHIFTMIELTDSVETAKVKEDIQKEKQKEYVQKKIDEWLATLSPEWNYDTAVNKDVYSGIHFSSEEE